MIDPVLGLTIVFNGCIYNYPALRAELEGLGYRFFSAGDTEVILKAWHAWGTECVDRFHGMFAFVHPRARHRPRRPGARPLRHQAALPRRGRPAVCASPRRCRLCSRRATSTPRSTRSRSHHYMSFHAVVPAPRTILKGVRKLPPATIRVIEPDGRTKERVYWAPDYRPARSDDLKISPEEWRDRDARRACGLRWSAAWSPTCRSACCCRAASIPASSSACSPRRARRT